MLSPGRCSLEVGDGHQAVWHGASELVVVHVEAGAGYQAAQGVGEGPCEVVVLKLNELGGEGRGKERGGKERGGKEIRGN